MNTSEKFLVSLVHSFSHRQLFFIVWTAIVGVFVLLMYAHYRKRTQRNFRQGDVKYPPSVYPRPLPPSPGSDTKLRTPKQLGK